MPNVFNLSDVFISYSRKDTDFVKRLDQAFKAENMEVWVDWEDIPLSANWMAEIEAGIEGADAFVFVISPASIASEICMEELEIAISRNKRFIPVLHREVDQLQGRAHEVISSHNWVFFRETDDFDDAFQNLLKTLKSDFDHTRQHTRLLVRANEWDSNNWREDFLLNGIELEAARSWLDTALNSEKSPRPTELHKLYIETSRATAIRIQRRNWAFATFGVLLAVLSIGLLVAFNTAREQQAIAETQSEIAGTQRAVAEVARAEAEILAEDNANAAQSMELALYANTIAITGDSFAALPFAMQAVEIDDSSYAGISLASIALEPGAMHWMQGHTNTVFYVDTHPSEPLAVSASSDTQLLLWDLSTRPPEVMHELEGHPSTVFVAEFSPDGNLIASGGNRSEVILWRTSDGQQEKVLVEVDGSLNLRADQLAFSPDGEYLLVSFETNTSMAEVHELRVFDIETGEVVQLVGGEGFSADSVAFSPDGSQFMAGLTNGEIWVWDFDPDPEQYNALVGTFTESIREIDEDEETDDEPAFEFPEPVSVLLAHGADDKIYHLDFSEDGQYLLSAGQDFDIYVWDWAEQSVYRQLDGHTDAVNAAEFIPGKNQVLSTSRDRTVIIWDIVSGEALSLMSGHESLPESLAVTSDGAFAITGSRTSGVMIFWDLDVVDYALDFDSGTDEVRRVDYHPTNPELAASISIDLPPSDDEPTLKLWNPLTGEVVQEFPDHIWGGLDVAWAQDARTIVVASGTELTLSDAATGEIINDAVTGNASAIFDLAVNPDNTNEILGATNNGDLLRWNLETGVEAEVIGAVNGGTRLLTVEYNPDNTDQVFISSNSALFIYDLKSQQIVYQLVGQTESIVGMAVNSQRNLLVTTDVTKNVYVWDYENRALLNVFALHTGTVWGVDISPDGRFVATASDNGEVLLWSLEVNALVRRFTYPNRRIRSVQFSPDGDYLLFGEQDMHTVRLYSTPELLEWIGQNRILDFVTCREQLGFNLDPECDPALNPAESITLDEPQRGSVHMDSVDTWLFDGTATQVIGIEVNADNPPPPGIGSGERRRIGEYLDTIVTVYDPEGNQIGTNDDASDETRNSLISELELLADGTYRIEVTSFGESSGDYDITVFEVRPPVEATDEPESP